MFFRPYRNIIHDMQQNPRWNEDIWRRYRAGTATREELTQLQAYLQQAHRPELEQLFAGEEATPLPAEAAVRIRQQLEQQAAVEKRIPVRRIMMKRWIAAAAIAIMIVSGSFYWISQSRKAPQVLVLTYDSVVNVSDAPRLVKLPDATQVWLNKKAKLYISKTYEQQRAVALTGEAYFDVVKNPDNPLVVHTGNIRTTVLGTAFNVDYTSSSDVRISLVQGKVRVNREGGIAAPVLLAPGETAIASTQADTIASGPTAIADVAGWIRGSLVLHQLPLAEALHKTAEYYGLKIDVDPLLLQGKKVTTIYYKHQQWQQVLHHLLFMYQLTYTTQQNRIVITRQ